MPGKMKAKLTLVGRLLGVISKVDRPGRVCTGGDLPPVMPGLEVDGLGTVRLPMGKKGIAAPKYSSKQPSVPAGSRT